LDVEPDDYGNVHYIYATAQQQRSLPDKDLQTDKTKVRQKLITEIMNATNDLSVALQTMKCMIKVK